MNRVAERIRRLAIIVRTERQVEIQTRTAYRKLLAQIAADVLDQKAPIVSALGDPNANRNQINAAWLLLLANIKRPLGSLFRGRFLGTGARRKALQAAEDAFLNGVTEHLQGVPNEVYVDLDRITADGITQGLTEQQIKERLRAELTPGHDEYNRRLDAIGQRVARTEATAAFNAGEDAGFADVQAQSGRQLVKTWLSTRDGRVRETHKEADGQIVAADGLFDVGGYEARFPGDWTLPPQESVNCRCTALYSNRAEALVAAGGDMTTPEKLPSGWRGPIAALDVPTSDNRMLATPPDGVIRTRAYPLTLTRNHVGDPTGYPTIGSVDAVWMQDGLLWGEGRFDLGGQDGQDAARQLAGGFINRMSIDPVEVTAQVRLYDANGNEVSYTENYDTPTELTEGMREVTVFTDWVLAGLAMVPIPAYTQAAVEPVFDYEPSQSRQNAEVVVAAIGGQRFTKEFFDFKATGPTKMTVTDDGHIYGHVRFHGTCYQYGQGRGDGGYCMEPPPSACGYAKFHAHSAILDDGSVIDVGALTFGDGHESRGGLIASRRHYDDVATIAAKVVASDDEWGVFVTGEVLDAHQDTAHDLLLSPLSGHWEPDADNDGHLEMLAAHIVVTPGYNVRRIVASFDEDRNATSIIVTNLPNATPAVRSANGVGDRPSGRALVAAAMADHRRARRLAIRAGVDPASRLERALARIAP